MLTCARIGGPHTVVFGGFATATAVRERLNVSRAKALIVADAARRKGKLIPVEQQVDEVISDLPDLETVVVVLRGQLSERLALGPPRGRGPRGGPWCGGGGGGGFPSG
jgi:acetyl-CoA synthetase